MRFIDRTLHLIDAINTWAARVGIFLIFILIIVGGYEVIMRSFLGRPTDWAWEFNGMILAAYIALGGGYTWLNKGHVRMDVLYEKFPRRIKATVDLVLSILFFVFVGALLWHASALAWTSLLKREMSITAWGPPLYPIKMLLPFGIFLLLLQGLASFIRNLRIALGWRGEP